MHVRYLRAEDEFEDRPRLLDRFWPWFFGGFFVTEVLFRIFT